MASQIAATERTAAKMLDMRPAEFRELVQAGSLPAPCQIGPHKRWIVEDLEAIVRGRAFKPKEDLDL